MNNVHKLCSVHIVQNVLLLSRNMNIPLNCTVNNVINDVAFTSYNMFYFYRELKHTLASKL